MRHDIASRPRTPTRDRHAGAAPARLARLVPLALAALGFAGAFAPPARALDIVPDFVVDNAVLGAAFDVPVCIKFLPDGRLLVLEKRGRLWVAKDGVRHPVPMWSREAEVLSNDDRGALGLEVDPDFATNRFIYLLYTVDPDSNGVDNNDEAFGRLVRYQVSATDSNALDPATRTVLIGTDWTHGILIASPTHTVGSLQFGSDGSLLVSAGEGAQFNAMDPGGFDPNAFGPGKTDPAEDVGAFRAQYLGSLAGKILRVNPANGHGYPSNPFWDGDPLSVRSRIWAYGIRNPFRITLRPGTGSSDPADGDPGTLYVGDVGWGDTEELDIVNAPGLNFGWPCYEGADPRPDYQAATPAHSGCGTIGSPANPGPLAWPVATWSHTDSSESVPPGAMGRTSIGGAFYTGTQYPLAYRGRYFQAEFTFGWIKVATMDAADQMVSLQNFADFTGGPVDLEADPISGDIFYVSLYGSAVRRIRYTGSSAGNTPPVAVAAAAPQAGIAPLEVSFSSAGSSDPDGDPLAFAWNFGDGQGSTEANPVHLYPAPGAYVAVLSVTDTTGAIDTSAVAVEVSEDFAFPTTGVLDAFGRADGPPGGAWLADGGGLAIADSALVQGAQDGGLVWDGAAFGADQEAHVVLAAPGGTGAHVLRLKLQGPSPSDGHAEVSWDAGTQQVSVRTFAPGAGWQPRGAWPVAFQAGERLGARARANGLLEVFRGGTRVATASLGDWPFAAAGGRIGVALAGAAGSALDDFGGGDAVLAFNTPPVAGIVSPADSAFFTAGDTLLLRGTAADAETPVAALAYRWDVDLHHNVHVHPSVEVVEDSTGVLVAANHDDGSGVWFEIRFAVTDGGGLSDTARVSVFPEVDLSPSWWSAGPPPIGTAGPAVIRFWLHNQGRMPAPYSRWRLTADGAVTLAEGDTLVAALDSVLVTCVVPPVLAAGPHVLRVTADTLATVVEPDEGDNGVVAAVTVVETGTTSVPAIPSRLRLSSAFPNPTAGRVSWTLELPTTSRVGWSVHDVAGRELWREPERAREAGRWTLGWDGRSASGTPAAAGVYLVRMRVDGAEFTRRFAILR